MKGSWQQCDCFAIARKQQRRTIVRGKERAAGLSAGRRPQLFTPGLVQIVISRDGRCLVLGLYREEPPRRRRRDFGFPSVVGRHRRGALHDRTTAPHTRSRFAGCGLAQSVALDLGMHPGSLGICRRHLDRDLLVFVTPASSAEHQRLANRTRGRALAFVSKNPCQSFPHSSRTDASKLLLLGNMRQYEDAF